MSGSQISGKLAKKIKDIFNKGMSKSATKRALAKEGVPATRAERLIAGEYTKEGRPTGLIKPGANEGGVPELDLGYVKKLDIFDTPNPKAALTGKDKALMMGGAAAATTGGLMKLGEEKETPVAPKIEEAPKEADKAAEAGTEAPADVKPEAVPEPSRQVIKMGVEYNPKDSPDVDPEIAEQYSKSVSEAGAMLDSALAMYRKEKESIKSKQLWEKIINAVGMIATGAIGLKTGSDLSGVKFSETDWNAEMNGARADLEAAMRASDRKETRAARKRSMEMQDHSTAIAQISAKNKNAFDKAQLQAGAQVNQERANAALDAQKETKRHNQAMEGVASLSAAAKAKSAASKGGKDTVKAVNDAARIIADAGKIEDDDQRRARYQQAKTMLTSAGIPVDDAMFESPSWFGDPNVAEPADVASKLNDMLFGSPTPVEMVSPEGETGMIPADKVEAALKAGFKRK